MDILNIVGAFAMQTMTSVEAQSRFGELIDRAQREPIALTRHGRVVAYVVSEHDMRAESTLAERREAAARWYSEYRARVMAQGPGEMPSPSDDEVNRLVHESR
jgi:antitoxin Phd